MMGFKFFEKENKLPLDTMHMILNKTQFVGKNRDEYFFQTALNKKPDTKKLFNQTFTKQSVLFIGEKPDEDEDEEELEQFKQDITNLFTKLIQNVTPFHIGGVELTISEFLDFLEDNVLPNVNKNSKVCFFAYFFLARSCPLFERFVIQRTFQ